VNGTSSDGRGRPDDDEGVNEDTSSGLSNGLTCKRGDERAEGKWGKMRQKERERTRMTNFPGPSHRIKEDADPVVKVWGDVVDKMCL
jgi:hypothetical protein